MMIRVLVMIWDRVRVTFTVRVSRVLGSGEV